MNFLVTYGSEKARFRRLAHAVAFARMASVLGSHWQTAAGNVAEVRRTRGDGKGLVAQFVDGKATPEFKAWG